MMIRHIELPARAAVVRDLLFRNDPDGGVLVIQARPDVRRITTLVHDLLAALGKRSDVSGVGRNTTDDVRYLEVWLRAHSVTDVVLIESNWLQPGVLAELLELLRPAEIDVWLADRLPMSAHHGEILHEVGSVRATPDELPGKTADVEARRPSFPQVPDDDFASFRWSCRELLPSEEFAKVDEVYTSIIQTLSQGPGALGEARVACCLGDVLQGISCADEAVTVVRAMQLVAVEHGARIKVNLPKLRRTAEIHATVGAESTWRAMRAYRQPFRSAVGVLVGMGLGLEDARRLPVGAVDISGWTIVIGDERRAVPSGAAVLLRACRMERELDGASLRDPLLARRGKNIAAPSLARALRDAATDLGIVLLDGQVDRSTPDARTWLRQRGISVQVAA